MTRPTDSTDPRYPMGPFRSLADPTPADRVDAIAALAELPNNLRNLTEDLAPAQLDTPYRQDGWTVRQLIHHLADSHMHAFLRVRLALTEDAPTIKPYDEAATAQLHDSLAAPIKWSLEILESLHARWVMLLQSLTQSQWQRTFHHPERGSMTVQQTTFLYAWHSRHHTAHIASLRTRERW